MAPNVGACRIKTNRRSRPNLVQDRSCGASARRRGEWPGVGSDSSRPAFPAKQSTDAPTFCLLNTSGLIPVEFVSKVKNVVDITSVGVANDHHRDPRSDAAFSGIVAAIAALSSERPR
jgi:hypothetical protein